MNGKNSKFEYDGFYGDVHYFAVNKDKYTYEEAIELLAYEFDGTVGNLKGEYLLKDGFVKWRAGVTEDNEPTVGWWLEKNERKNGSCPVYIFEQRWQDQMK